MECAERHWRRCGLAAALNLRRWRGLARLPMAAVVELAESHLLRRRAASAIQSWRQLAATGCSGSSRRRRAQPMIFMCSDARRLEKLDTVFEAWRHEAAVGVALRAAAASAVLFWRRRCLAWSVESWRRSAAASAGAGAAFALVEVRMEQKQLRGGLVTWRRLSARAAAARRIVTLAWVIGAWAPQRWHHLLRRALAVWHRRAAGAAAARTAYVSALYRLAAHHRRLQARVALAAALQRWAAAATAATAAEDAASMRRRQLHLAWGRWQAVRARRSAALRLMAAHWALGARSMLHRWRHVARLATLAHDRWRRILTARLLELRDAAAAAAAERRAFRLRTGLRLWRRRTDDASLAREIRRGGTELADSWSRTAAAARCLQIWRVWQQAAAVVRAEGRWRASRAAALALASWRRRTRAMLRQAGQTAAARAHARRTLLGAVLFRLRAYALSVNWRLRGIHISSAAPEAADLSIVSRAAGNDGGTGGGGGGGSVSGGICGYVSENSTVAGASFSHVLSARVDVVKGKGGGGTGAGLSVNISGSVVHLDESALNLLRCSAAAGSNDDY
ncbi:unnamed protein product [Phaeothamnion confervicola]